MIRLTLAIAAAAVLSGCGNPACTQPCAQVRPQYPTAGFAVVVTENDRAVTVREGQKIELVLHAKPGMSDWGGVNVDDTTVLRAVPTGIAAARGVTIAGYEAVRPGSATIRATATPLCSPGQACPAFAMIFEVTVTVT